MNSSLCAAIAKTFSRLSIYLFLLSALAAPAFAQVTASMSGTVEDKTGAVIPNATVTVKSVETGVTRVVHTDAAGSYRVLSLPIGRYQITAENTGFQSETKSGINLTIGQEAVVNFTLALSEVKETVTVSAEAATVNTTTTSVAGLVGEQEVKDLPLNGRSFDNLITLNAGTVNFTGQRGGGGVVGTGNVFSIAGRRITENLFLFNGVEYTGSAIQAVTPGGVSGELLGIDAIREFNVASETYGVEYGKRAGGQVAIVTMSGGNQFHGSAFEFLRNSKLDARNFFDRRNVPPPFKRNNFGGSAGGPLWKDKTFIFGNYEGFRQRLGLSLLSFVPDANARQGLLPVGPGGSLVNVLAPGVAPYFALWPAPNGRNLGGGIAEAFSNPSQAIREDFGTVRGDHNFFARDMLNAVYTVDDGTSFTPGAAINNPLSAATINLREQVASLQEQHIFSSNLINSFTLGFTRSNFSYDQNPTIDLPANLSFIQGRPVGLISIGGGTGAAASSVTAAGGFITVGITSVRNLFTVTDSIQRVKGNHVISAGVWFERVQSNENAASFKNGQAVFTSLQSFMQGTVATFLGVPEPSELGWRSLEVAWYLQDTVKLKPNLTVTLGFRHEFTNGWNEVAGRASNYTPGPFAGTLLTPRAVGDSLFTQNNAKKLFSPRAGLAWDPFGTGKTSIHAGAGIYYSLMDDLGFCCTSVAPFNRAVTLTNLPFPLQITPGTPVPGSKDQPSGIMPDIKTPTVVRWSFKLEQAIGAGIGVSAAYVGSRGYHGTGQSNLNTAVPQIQPDGTKFFPAGGLLRNPNLGAPSIQPWQDFVDSHYHALQLEIRRQFGQGLQFRANYTFAKSMDNSSGMLSNHATNSPGGAMDPENPARDRSLSSFNIAHRLSINGSYELPVGQGKTLLGQASGAMNKLVAGWQLNGILNAQSGLPFTPTLGFNRSQNGDSKAPDRPDFASGITRAQQLSNAGPNLWFDPRQFVLPTAGTFGNVGRNVLIGPRQFGMDLSLFKTTQITEKLKLQFRTEAFNLLNHANFGIPAAVVSSPTGAIPGSAGRISSTATTSRQLQFGLKLIW